MKSVAPAISLSSFNCPHCKVLAQQFWFTSYSYKQEKDWQPTIWRGEEAEERIAEIKKGKDYKEGGMDDVFAWLRSLSTGEVIFSENRESNYTYSVSNLFFSQCYHCNRISVWIYDQLVHPQGYDAPPANPDMPPNVLNDYAEAGAIAGASPRGAAALLRLAIQRLMPHLGEKGKNLDDDIASLVKKGLDPRIQRSLDIVRVIGNNAVHPGTISFDDNAETVSTLFKLVNVIVDVLISQPKHIEEAYGGLPPGARAAIEKRDKAE